MVTRYGYVKNNVNLLYVQVGIFLSDVEKTPANFLRLKATILEFKSLQIVTHGVVNSNFR